VRGEEGEFTIKSAVAKGTWVSEGKGSLPAVGLEESKREDVSSLIIKQLKQMTSQSLMSLVSSIIIHKHQTCPLLTVSGTCTILKCSI
jgi:hypothetical protein